MEKPDRVPEDRRK